MEHETALKETLRERARFMQSLGKPTNIDLPGGNQELPQWPSDRHNYVHILTQEATHIITSDGLSDPFLSGPPKNGFEMECFAETREDIGENPYVSWLFSLVFQASENAAFFGGFRSELEKRELLVMELTGIVVPDRFLNPTKTVGVILGIKPPHRQEVISLPLSDTRYMSVKMLTRKQFEYIVEQDTERRKREIADYFIAEASFHLNHISS